MDQQRSDAARVSSQKDTTRFAIRYATLLLLPVLAVIGWFAGVYVLQEAMTTDLWSDTSAVYVLHNMALSAVTLTQATTTTAMVSPPHTNTNTIRLHFCSI